MSEVKDTGPWWAEMWDNGDVVVQSDDFDHDVALVVNGNFANAAARLEYAKWLADVLTKATQTEG